MSEILEVVMIVSFGASWPMNVMKSWKARTAKGKSLQFELCVVIGYLFGICGKFISGNITYVLVVYVIDVTMVTIDILLTLRNMALDRMAEKKKAKEMEV